MADQRIELDDLHSILALLAGDTVEVDIAHCRQIAAAADLFVLIVEIYLEHRLSALAHLSVAHIDVLHYASSAGVGLDAHDSVEVRAVHLVVFSEDIATPT